MLIGQDCLVFFVFCRSLYCALAFAPQVRRLGRGRGANPEDLSSCVPRHIRTSSLTRPGPRNPTILTTTSRCGQDAGQDGEDPGPAVSRPGPRNPWAVGAVPTPRISCHEFLATFAPVVSRPGPRNPTILATTSRCGQDGEDTGNWIPDR